MLNRDSESSGMLRRVVRRIVTDVSEYPSEFIFRVKWPPQKKHRAAEIWGVLYSCGSRNGSVGGEPTGGGSSIENCLEAVSREVVNEAETYYQTLSAGSKVCHGRWLYQTTRMANKC